MKPKVTIEITHDGWTITLHRRDGTTNAHEMKRVTDYSFRACTKDDWIDHLPSCGQMADALDQISGDCMDIAQAFEGLDC